MGNGYAMGCKRAFGLSAYLEYRQAEFLSKIYNLDLFGFFFGKASIP